MKVRLLFALVLCCVGIGDAAAQWLRRPPALLFRERGKLKPMNVTRVDVEALVTGFLARTTMTLTFHNPNRRVMAAELVFPLPEGAVVSGYGLDIGGQVVAASVVERERARVAFETEVRRGIDPGLVEWTQGNNFRTRVYPIPAGGRRTIRVSYVSDLVLRKGSAVFVLPLAFKKKVERFKLKVEVVKGPARPRIAAGGLANFRFKRWQDRFVAETVLEDATVSQDLRIALPRVPSKVAVVEQVGKGAASGTYFAIHDRSPVTRHAAGTSRRIRRIGVLWDASWSRARADKKRDRAILAALLKRVGNVAVDVFLVRNDVGPSKRFNIRRGKTGALVAYLKGIPYDGGTDLGRVEAPDSHDFWLLFSDGLSSVGRGRPEVLGAPVYAVNGASTANHSLLRYVARRSGGAYFNLQRTKNSEVVGGILAGRNAWRFLRAEFDSTKISDLVLGDPRMPGGRFTLAGRLVAAQATITLLYGQERPTKRVKYTLRRAGAGKTGLVARFWAQRRADELAMFAERNRDEMIRLGKAHNLVTPATSLLVLETLDQHLQHRVMPAPSRSKLRERYVAAMESRGVGESETRRSKLARVVKLWQDRVHWWNKAYEYPPDFRYGRVTSDKGRSFGAGAGLGDDRVSLSARRPRLRVANIASPSPRRYAAHDTAVADAKEKKSESKSMGRAAGITVKPWDPKTPYLAAMKLVEADKAYEVYLLERAKRMDSPAFYLDCAAYLFRKKQHVMALRVLTNIAELRLASAPLLRVVAHKARQEGEIDLAVELFERVRKLRAEEPQSFRDLALALVARAAKRPKAERVADYDRALRLFDRVVTTKWDGRFPEIETIVLMEANQLLARAKREGVEVTNPLDPRLVKNLAVDVRIVLTWDQDLTDMDLWVIEPSGEKAYYSHNRTTIGGRVSRDFTRGYGPEEYLVRRAMPGKYQIRVNFYGSSQVTLTGGTTVQATVITNFGRPGEKRRAITLRLRNRTEVIDVGAITFGK